jgi:chromatin remodeling complex protein RSC6
VEAAPVEEVNVVAEFNNLVTKVASLREVFASVLSDMKKLEKRIPRELKKASKKRKGAKAADGDKPKRESIFKKPVQISDELCVFLGKAKGTLMSRSDVTTAVCTYARTNGLMNKQVINADASLRKLLKITESDPELMILNLQRFLKPHYIKSA